MYTLTIKSPGEFTHDTVMSRGFLSSFSTAKSDTTGVFTAPLGGGGGDCDGEWAGKDAEESLGERECRVGCEGVRGEESRGERVDDLGLCTDVAE